MATTDIQPRPLLDFDRYIAERTQAFAGRQWVLESIDEWLSNGTSRWFLLSGEPGSGKTAIAARLAQLSRGDVPAIGELRPGFLSAIHFCSARDATWVDPLVFARSVARQLLRIPGFGQAVLEHAGERPANVQGAADANQVGSGAVVAGVYIENLKVAAPDARDVFNRLVRLPLQTVYERGYQQPITLLVDGLDESLRRQGDVSIVSLLGSLEYMPPPVHFILTTRDDDAVKSAFLGVETDGLLLSAAAFHEQNSEDLSDYVKPRLIELPGVEALDAAEREAAAKSIVDKADGNFRYAQFLLDALVKKQHSLDDLDHLPAGLDVLYLKSLERIAEYEPGDFAPILGTLAAAQAPLTETQLRRFSGQSSADVVANLRRLQQFVEELVPADPRDESRYRLYHDSVADFVDKRSIVTGSSRLLNRFFVAVGDWHRRIADTYLGAGTNPWRAWDDEYGIQFVPTHLAEAVRRSDVTTRHADVERLVRLVLNDDFQATHLELLDDLPALERDLELACASAALNEDQAGTQLLVEAALARVIFRRERLRPEALFSLAREGHLAAAERRLALFTPDADWRRAVLLILAWLGADSDADAARAVCQRVLNEIGGPPPQGPLFDLLTLAQSAIDGAPPVVPRPLVSGPEPEEVIRAALGRIGGLGGTAELLSAYNNSLIVNDAAPVYMAQQDGPLLVAFAAAYRDKGTRFFLDYLSVHASYAYVEYRNQSLWHLLDAVVRHPDPQWTHEMVPLLAATALTGSSVQFHEGLLLTVLALRASTGVRGAVEQFNAHLGTALAQAPPPGVSYARGEGDAWGMHRRRLAALAELLSQVLDRAPEADALLLRTAELPRGFAGYQAPSSLRLAEAVRVCQPHDAPAVDAAIQTAWEAANNIQDALFCARMTARVNAIARRWWGPASVLSADPAAIAGRLSSAPDGAEFAAMHVVGEDYAERMSEPGKLPIPDWVRQARTLTELAHVYQRPCTSLRRLNRAPSDVDQPLPDGTLIDIPDPGLTALLAGRMSAEALVSPAVAGPARARQRLAMIRGLVPAAVVNPTALDVVLSRFLIAARPTEPATLDTLENLARQALAEGPPSGGLPGNLTAFVP